MRFVAVWWGLVAVRRWRAHLVFAVLVAVALGVVLAAFAGARRGASAQERLREGALAADLLVQSQIPDFDWDRVRALPGVAAVAPTAVSALRVRGVRLGWDSAPPTDAELWRSVERPAVLEGRLPDPARADEVVVLPRFVEEYGKGVGDSVVIQLSTPEEVNLVADSAGTPEAHGPEITARIVGVIRSPYFTDPSDGAGTVLPSPGLFQKYQENFLGVDGRGGFTIALVRLTEGEAGLPAFRAAYAELTGIPAIKIDNLEDRRRQANQLLIYEATVLVALGLAALAAGALLVAQLLARLVGLSLAELRNLRAAGLTPRQAVAAATLGPALTGAAGAVLGVLAAAVASVWMPIGAAALYEPAPGLDLDWAVLLPGLLGVPALLAAGGAGYAWALLATTRTVTRPAPSMIATAAGRRGWPVPVQTGLRFALERGRGGNSLPVTSALVGTVAGVLGVLTAFTFAAGVHDAATNPARYGQTHQLIVFLGFNGQGAPPEAVLRAIATDPDVAGAEDRPMSTALSGNLTISLYARSPGETPIPAGRLVEGRPPSGPDEVLLAARTAGALHAGVGDRVPITGTLGTRDFTVTGIGFVPEGPANNYAEGALTTADGFRSLFSAYEVDFLAVALRPGADLPAAMGRLSTTAATATGGIRLGFVPFFQPRQLVQIRGLSALPAALGALLAALALAATGHTLRAAVRRRRHEVAVLRALGMTPAQARWVVLTQAGVLALAGLVAGVPLGLALGRTLWRVVAESAPLLYAAPTPVTTLLLITPAALLAAMALAASPARTAARTRVAAVLRAE
ncbi:ABC transporter permease [Acrocarpospora catenulata]|uniref:ABC transporter permease n=1 Tax=Acrocarpospora catenulata TaxID=2836182 RepID=UPI001BDAB8A2|nr:ABC transporter permease [Acrocarpospora catenulata]